VQERLKSPVQRFDYKGGHLMKSTYSEETLLRKPRKNKKRPSTRRAPLNRKPQDILVKITRERYKSGGFELDLLFPAGSHRLIGE